MIIEKHKIEDYRTVEYLQPYVDKGIIEIIGKEFIDYKRINVKKIKNRIRKGKTTSKKSLGRIADYKKKFQKDGGWNPFFPCGVYVMDYGKNGEEHSPIGYNHKTLGSVEEQHNPPGVKIKWSDDLSEAEKTKYFDELLAFEQTNERINQDDASKDEIIISLRLAKSNYEAVDALGITQEFDTVEKYLNNFLKTAWKKDPRDSKWAKILKKLLGNNSSYANVVDFSSVPLASEFIKNDYDGDFVFRTGNKIIDDFKFDNNTHKILEGSTQLFKPEFIYSGTLRRRFGDLIVELNQSNERGDTFVYSLFFGLGGKQKHLTLNDIDKERKALITEVEHFYSIIKKAGLKHRILLTAFLGQKTDELGTLVDYETEKKRLIK